MHGKAKTSELLPPRLEYESGVLLDWMAQAQAAGEAVLYLLYARYGEDIDIGADSVLQEIMIERFGHLSAVRDTLDLAGD